MKTVSIGMTLLMGLSVAQAGDKPVLTIEKIQYVAMNCASSSGFAAWLESKPGITKVVRSPILLVSAPPKSNVSFTMHGERYDVRVGPRRYASGEVASISLNKSALNHTHEKYSRREQQEIQYLDKMLAEYETRHKN